MTAKSSESEELDKAEQMLGHNHHRRIGGDYCPMALDLQALIDAARTQSARETLEGLLPEGSSFSSDKAEAEFRAIIRDRLVSLTPPQKDGKTS